MWETYSFPSPNIFTQDSFKNDQDFVLEIRDDNLFHNEKFNMDLIPHNLRNETIHRFSSDAKDNVVRFTQNAKQPELISLISLPGEIRKGYAKLVADSGATRSVISRGLLTSIFPNSDLKKHVEPTLHETLVDMK